MPRNSLLLRLLLAAALCLVTPAGIAQINACKYLQITDFTSDPYAIAQELRAQARKHGFTVISNLSEIQREEVFKACVMKASGSAGMVSGQLSVRVVDAFSGELITEASTVGTNWWGVGRTVRKGVEKIYSQLGYKGFSESVYQSRMQRLYPPRPTLAVTEEQIRKGQPKTLLEGIWSDPTDTYRMAIVPASQGGSADYLGVVLRSDSPLWQAGEIKAEFRSTATPEVFTSTYFMGNKKPVGATFILEHGVILHTVANTSTGQTDLVFLRVWPKAQMEAGKEEPGKGKSTGTGFFLNNNGLLATNWHVVNGATHITLTLPEWKEEIKGELLTKDITNDLAIIKAGNLKKLKDTCPGLPYQLTSSISVALGQHVSTIGYPLSPLLGSSPKFSEGVISSKSGVQDDPTHLQITVPIQPGNSGGPLFDAGGNVIGIVDSSFSTGSLYRSEGIMAQNVNYAIKSDYLLSLMSMLPNETLSVRTGTFSAETASRCVAFIHAW